MENSLDKQFLKNLSLILHKGEVCENRTGINTIAYAGVSLRHDMAEGFPLLTIRKMPFNASKVELQGFINGITSKSWYKENGCNFWNEWCSPVVVPYGNDDATKKRMLEEDDLGPIYGAQWRSFSGQSDQLKEIITELKKNPDSRRMVVSSWNPLENKKMALMPCHTHWQIDVINGRLNLYYYQRSCDYILGNNLSSYGLLLHLLAKESGLKEGVLTAFWANTHIYENQMDGVKELLKRKSEHFLPKVKTEKFESIFNWKHQDTILEEYKYQPPIKFPIAV